MYECRDEGSEDRYRKQGEDIPSSSVVVSPAAPEDRRPSRHIGKHVYCAGDGSDYRHDQGIPVVDMGKFVGDDAFELVVA